MDHAISFGGWLSRRRKALGLTRAELARRAACAVVTLRKIEEDARRPSPELAAQLARHIQVADVDLAGFIAVARGERGPDWLPAPELPTSAAEPPSPVLPIPATELIGREHEIAAACALLQHEHVRLLVLTGPGGVGKTRLALAVAHALRGHYRDGVVFVSLSDLRDPALVPSSVAQTLGLLERGSQSLPERIRTHLRSRQTLLVLDNFEQVLSAGPMVAALVGGAPNLQVLITSRVVLQVSGERSFDVQPLGLPDGGASPSAEPAAVTLFNVRARAANARLALSHDQIPLVAQICRRLDGLPLAIELVAAWVRTLPLPAILAYLQNTPTIAALPLLAGGPRDRPAHQQTLQATLAWSYNLLGSQAQECYRRLAIFVGGCSLEAACAVLIDPADQGATSGDTHVALARGLHVLSELHALVDASLLRQTDRAGEAGFGMLETIREDALQRLIASGEAQQIHARHAAYYLALLEQDGANRDSAWLRRVRATHDNVRAALAWAIDQQHTDWAGRMARRLEWFWFAHGHISEGRAWMRRVLGLPSGEPHVQAVLGRMAGYFAFFQGDYPEARALFTASLAGFQELGDMAGSADLQINLAMVAEAQGAAAEAEQLCAASLALRRTLDAIEPLADALYHLGRLTLLRGDAANAHGLLRESLALFERVERIGMMPIVLNFIGYADLARGAAQQAAASLRKALTMLYEQGNIFVLPYSLVGLAGVCCVQQPGLAARLLGVVQHLVAETDLHPSPGERAIWERIGADAQARLGAAAYADAQREGQAMALDDAVALALQYYVLSG